MKEKKLRLKAQKNIFNKIIGEIFPNLKKEMSDVYQGIRSTQNTK